MNLHRVLIKALIGLVMAGAVLLILRIWGVFLDGVFFKLLGTIGILILLAGFLLAVKQDFGEHKRLKDENFID